MEVEAPYLQAIQGIAGTTPGEKYKTINIIARQIAEAERSSGNSVKTDSKISHLPELLMPLIRVEVAKILHRYEGIIEGLKSEDITVVNRALKARWFFDGSDSSLLNAQYFLTNIFPEVSLYTRFKILKQLSVHLKNTAIAMDFFLALVQQYGINQALPLLVACDEDFAFKMVIEKKIVLSVRIVTMLYRKYPELVIKYLRLSEPNNNDVRNRHQINLRDYSDFFPEVANDRLKDLMEICRMQDKSYPGFLTYSSWKLGKKATDTFIKTQLDFLVNKPDEYLRLVSLKSLTRKLSVSDFKRVFKSLFPANVNNLSYYSLCKPIEHLEFYEPKQGRGHLIMDTFRELYGKDLLSCEDLMHPDFVCLLSADYRVKQARMMLEDDKDWHLDDAKRSWRCYLPTSESIPAITEEISKSSDAHKRDKLFTQLAYTCKVNSDKDALLGVLNYICDTPRNNQQFNFYRYLSESFDWIDMPALSSTDWGILNKYIKLAEIHDLDPSSRSDLYHASKIMEARICYCLLNRLPLDDHMPIFVATMFTLSHPNCKYPIATSELQKELLETVIDFIPKQYPDDHKIWKDGHAQTIHNLISSLLEFNNRHRVNSNAKIRKLYIKDYPWLLERVKAFASHRFWNCESLLKLVQKNEGDFYYNFIGELDKFWETDEEVMFDVLKRYPQRVLDSWKECLEKVHSAIDPQDRGLSRFIIRSRWYQKLPLKFFNESLRIYNDGQKTSSGAVLTLALLTDGENYTKIIEPFIPNDEKVNTDDPIARNTFKILSDVSECLWKVNPPVPLDVIAKFCVGDYLQMTLRSVMSVSHRVSVTKVYKFAEALTDRRASVMKHGIRMMFLVASVEEIYTFITDLWNTQGHKSIRELLFSKICVLFSNQPDSRNWHMFRRCLDTLTAGQDSEMIFRSLPPLSRIPSKYISEYIVTVLNIMEYMKEESEDTKSYTNLSSNLIKQIDGSIADVLPEEYCQFLIQKYLFVSDYDSDIFETGKDFAIKSYLLGSKEYNELRFKFFGDFFRDCVRKYWDKSHSKNSKFYPMNFMVRKFFAGGWSEFGYKRHFESLLEIFQSVLQPHQDAVSYLYLVFSIEYQKSMTAVNFSENMVNKLPELIEVLSPACLILIADRFDEFISRSGFQEPYLDSMNSMFDALVENGTIHCAFIAAYMLFHKWGRISFDKREKPVVNKLRDFNHPAISWLVNRHKAFANLSEHYRYS